MQESLTIGAKELGEQLMPSSKDPARWIQNHHAELTEKHGMPRELPGGWVWSRLATVAWLATYGAPRETRVAATQNLIRKQQEDILAAFSGRAA